GLPERPTVVAFVLILAGLATKIGWAPVHNWLPDAHSEAPAPISALLSAALLPTVVLVAWRVKATLDVAVGGGTAGALFLAFGLASVIVAIPFLWRALPWKRLLAYSSPEHMGVIALGIGFGPALALGFLGLLHALLEGVVGPPAERRRRARSRTERPIAIMTAVLGAGLLALTAATVLLPGSAFVDTLAGGAL